MFKILPAVRNSLILCVVQFGLDGLQCLIRELAGPGGQRTVDALWSIQLVGAISTHPSPANFTTENIFNFQIEETLIKLNNPGSQFFL